MIPLTARQRQALRDGAKVLTFVEMGHPNGTLYLTSSPYPLTVAGQTWIGAGRVGTVAGISWSFNARIGQVSLTMAYVPTDELDVADTDLKGYTATIYQGIVTETDRLVDDLIEREFLDLDHQRAEVQDDGHASISVIGSTQWWTLENPIRRRWSPEEQRKVYGATDTGMDGLAELEDYETSWTPT